MTVSLIPTDQKYQGDGRILKADQFLARVRYDLDEEQERISIEEAGTRAPLVQRGQKRLRGTIVVIEGDEDLEKYSGGPIILHLADNRPVQIVITSRTKRTPPTYKVRQ